jgi:hypothetical protein
MNKFHFFATSVAEYHVDSDLRALMKFMDKRGFEYGIWYVPGDVNGSEYEIKSFRPQVEGSVFLGKYQPKK